MKVKISICIIIIISLLTAACSSDNSAYTKYSYEFVGAFDTTIQLIGYAKSEADFKEMADIAQDRFMELHRLFDIYNDYNNLNNTKTINDNAGIQAVKVQQEIIDLLVLSKQWYYETNGKCNIALGSVLKIWHNYRDAGKKDPQKSKIPTISELNEANKYTDIEKIIVDTENGTVFLEDKNMSLDLGAVAKGFASELVANELMEKGYTSFIISSGGNVRVVGEPLNGNRSKWGIGLQNPFDPYSSTKPHLDVIYINDSSVVTSGDYQRYYTVNGQNYHHLIDPDTLMPADYFKSVTIVTEDSGFADFMSTTLFLTPYDEGLHLTQELGIAAVWVKHDGTVLATDNAKEIMKDLGGASNTD